MATETRRGRRVTRRYDFNSADIASLLRENIQRYYNFPIKIEGLPEDLHVVATLKYDLGEDEL